MQLQNVMQANQQRNLPKQEQNQPNDSPAQPISLHILNFDNKNIAPSNDGDSSPSLPKAQKLFSHAPKSNNLALDIPQQICNMSMQLQNVMKEHEKQQKKQQLQHESKNSLAQPPSLQIPNFEKQNNSTSDEGESKPLLPALNGQIRPATKSKLALNIPDQICNISMQLQNVMHAQKQQEGMQNESNVSQAQQLSIHIPNFERKEDIASNDAGDSSPPMSALQGLNRLAAKPSKLRSTSLRRFKTFPCSCKMF